MFFYDVEKYRQAIVRYCKRSDSMVPVLDADNCPDYYGSLSLSLSMIEWGQTGSSAMKSENPIRVRAYFGRFALAKSLQMNRAN